MTISNPKTEITYDHSRTDPFVKWVRIIVITLFVIAIAVVSVTSLVSQIVTRNADIDYLNSHYHVSIGSQEYKSLAEGDAISLYVGDTKYSAKMVHDATGVYLERPDGMKIPTRG
jgi:uncharacterized protein YpmB